MAENSGFRVDRLGSIDARTGGKADHIFTILDYPWVATWMSPRETIIKIVNRDPTHQVIMLGALAGGLTMLNFFLGAALKVLLHFMNREGTAHEGALGGHVELIFGAEFPRDFRSHGHKLIKDSKRG